MIQEGIGHCRGVTRRRFGVLVHNKCLWRRRIETSYLLDIHNIHVQCNVQSHYSDYSSGRLDFRSQIFLRPIATVCTAQTLQAPGRGEPGNEAGNEAGGGGE